MTSLRAKRLWLLPLSLFAGMQFSALVFASEKVGTTEIEYLRLRPTFLSREDVGGEFDISESELGIKWSKDKHLSAFLGLGSEKLRNLPVFYAAPNADQLGFYQAYAEYEGLYGVIRYGLIPLRFGYDGNVSQDQRHFDRALPYQERVIALTDIGFSFYTEHNGYFTEIIVHNGEVDTTSDGRLWTTGRWGYDNGQDFLAEMSLQSGFVEGPLSTGNTGRAIAGVTYGETAKWRNGLLYVHWHPRTWDFVAQYGGGEVEQTGYDGSYGTQLLELSKTLSKNFATGFRYDEFDPNLKVNGDKITEMSLVFVFKSSDSTSEFSILGTKVSEQQNEVPNDELRLVWLLTPFTL